MLSFIVASWGMVMREKPDVMESGAELIDLAYLQ